MLRTAVIGVGSLGRQHARIHATLTAEGISEFTAVCDLNEETARSISDERKTDWTTNWRELIGRIDAASVAVPMGPREMLAVAQAEFTFSSKNRYRNAEKRPDDRAAKKQPASGGKSRAL